MSMLDINRKLIKIIAVYFYISIFTLIFSKVYLIFSHGVYSKYIDSMFLYPLIGGAFVYLIILTFMTDVSYKKNRISFNIYNSGIAILTMGRLLHGILEIAGISSEYIIYYSIIGFIFVGYGIISLFVNAYIKKRK